MRKTEYPNPDAVQYARPMPPGFPCQLTTQTTGKSYPIHNHGAWLNAQGDGNTDVDSGHFHRVRGFKVLPDQSDGHTHEMTMLPCGAGAPRTVGRDGQQIVALGDDGAPMVQFMAAPAPFWTPLKIVGAVALVAGLAVGGFLLYRHLEES